MTKEEKNISVPECIPSDKHLEHYSVILGQLADAHEIERTVRLFTASGIQDKMNNLLIESGWSINNEENELLAYIYSIEKTPNLIDTIKEDMKILKKDGLIFIYTPLADKCITNAWSHLNTPRAGENINLISTKGFGYIAEDLGLTSLKADIIGDSALMVFKRKIDYHGKISRQISKYYSTKSS